MTGQTLPAVPTDRSTKLARFGRNRVAPPQQTPFMTEGQRLCWTESHAAFRGPAVLNRFDRPSPMAGEAELKYLDGDFRIVRPGAFVRCAVTGVPIPLEELKYWSVEHQEPYATPEAVMQRLHPDRAR